MNIKLIFRIQAVLNLINGIGALIATKVFLEAGNFEVTPDLITLGQFLAVTLIIFGIIAWKIPDLAGHSINSFGKLFALTNTLWVIIIGYHILNGQASGPTPYVNIVLIAILAVLFFTQSNKSNQT